MNEDDLVEALLRPCVPSEGFRRDESLARAGAPEREIMGVKSALAALAASIGAQPAPPSLRARLLASVEREGRHGRYADRLARLFDLPMDAAEALAASAEDPAAFSPFFIPGVELIQVQAGPRFPGSLAVIARIRPGARFPEHVHLGRETMVVLAGGFREDGPGGSEIWRGDELVSDQGSGHAFVALEGEPCVTASLVEGMVEFK